MTVRCTSTPTGASNIRFRAQPSSDWNYITIDGQGVYAGDTLAVMNPEADWWGEGDEKIWVDGEEFRSHFGTGTEDYYGYAYGGGSTDLYQKPFHAQVRCGQKATFGQNTPNPNTLVGRHSIQSTTPDGYGNPASRIMQRWLRRHHVLVRET